MKAPGTAKRTTFLLAHSVASEVLARETAGGLMGLGWRWRGGWVWHTLRCIVGDWNATGLEVGVVGAVGDVREGGIGRERISDLRGRHVGLLSGVCLEC